MLGTKEQPGTAMAFVRVVALLTPRDYRGVIHLIGESLFTSREKPRCLCNDISLPLYEINPQIEVASRAYLHTTQPEMSHFFASKYEQKK